MLTVKGTDSGLGSLHTEVTRNAGALRILCVEPPNLTSSPWWPPLLGGFSHSFLP